MNESAANPSDALLQNLHLSIITYNRAEKLEATLIALSNSPFARCHITVLDNESTDRTPAVCAQFAELLPSLEIVRHRYNIGASANFLRAVERSASPYSWILGDDDHFDFSDCADVCEAVASSRFDLISVGSPAQADAERGVTATADELVRSGTRYYSSFTFLTGVIFRTALFDRECIYLGYQNTGNFYPHFPFVCRSVERRFSVYTSKHRVVQRVKGDEAHLPYLQWFTAWANSCYQFIKPRDLRKKAIYDFSERTFDFSTIFFTNARLKADGKAFGWKHYWDIFFALVGEQKLVWLAYLPLFVLPPWAYVTIRRLHRLYRRLRHGIAPSSRAEPDQFRL